MALDSANKNGEVGWMRTTMADQLNMPVTFMGENPVYQLMFANGTLLVTDLFSTPQEGVERFGKRIRVMSSEMKFSAPYQDGIAAAQAGKPYAPVRTHGRQAVLEYGTGYLRGLLNPVEAPVAPPKPAPPVIVPAPRPEPEPVVPAAPLAPAKKRGRPRKQKLEEL